ncbi:MAG TPA: hypothetical protein VGP43_01740 [Chitinophagaceae bacterium]|nr:hypothetical protein [Chitinophagaceae bacterium]
MSPEEFEDNIDPQTKRYILRRSIMDIGMGLIYISIAFVILFANKLRLYNEFAQSMWGKVFAVLFILYGVWRVYRGIKKDYLKDR